MKGKSPNSPFMPEYLRGRKREQMQMVQVGAYTGVRYNILSPDDDFEIYDIEKDPRQSINLARTTDLRELQAKMKARALQQRRPHPKAPRPYDDAPIPATAADNVQSGKIATLIYEGKWPWMPDFKTLTPSGPVRFAPAISSQDLPDQDHFGVVFFGYINITEPGPYTFYGATDSGCQLFIHDARVIDDDFARTGQTLQGTLHLAAGLHPIRFYYRHATGPRKLELDYSGPTLARQPIPASALAIPQNLDGF